MSTGERETATIASVVAAWQDQGIRNVRFELPDMHGTSRSKLIPISHVASKVLLYFRDQGIESGHLNV